jgi:hypothetical protein
VAAIVPPPFAAGVVEYSQRPVEIFARLTRTAAHQERPLGVLSVKHCGSTSIPCAMIFFRSSVMILDDGKSDR